MSELELVADRPTRTTWQEAAYVILSFSVVLLAAGAGYNFYVLFGETASDTERWMVTLTTAFANLCAALIAYLTAREVRLNDADKKIQKADLDRALIETKECKEDRAKLHINQEKMQRKIDRLMRKNQLDEDEEGDADEYVERRGEPDPEYKGPLRRKDDKKPGSKLYRKLPPKTPPPET